LKQIITIEQLKELTLQQKDILRKWWNPEIHTFFVVNNTIYPCEDGKCFGKDEVANGGCVFKIEYQGKNLKDVLDELSQQWSNVVDNNFQNISSIKKQIKHSRNPLEIKMLNKKLNELYKNK